MNYAESLQALRKLGNELRGVKFDLETIEAVLGALGNPHRRVPSAIVAGTNGKGSTSAMLASIIRRAGLRTGLYTSPHLVRVNERIVVGGQEISDEDFAYAFTQVSDAASGLFAQGMMARQPSYFEMLTAAAFVHFARAGVEIAVLEVGMGGRLDATNVVEPLVSVITNVALDHEQYLGSTVEAIAVEKAGVIKPGCPAISGCENEAAAQVIRGRCRETGSNLLDLRRAAHISNVRPHGARYSFDLELEGVQYRGMLPALAGRFQIKNAVAAVAAAHALRRQGMKIPAGAIEEGMSGAQWPGRLQAINERPLVLLDGAHNPAAAAELAGFIREQLHGRRIRLVYASMRDKAIENIASSLFPLAYAVYLTRPDVERAATAEEILARLHGQHGQVVVEPRPARALEIAVEASAEDDVVIVAGSLFLVGAILEALENGLLVLQPGPAAAVSDEPLLSGPRSRR